MMVLFPDMAAVVLLMVWVVDGAVHDGHGCWLANHKTRPISAMAVITSIDFTFVDNSASDIIFSLRMLAPNSNITLSSVTSSGELGLQTLTISPNVVVDNAYGYQLRIGFTSTSGQLFNHATVHYVPSTTFLPEVSK
jgi:hypothetical protein